jgi:hypothetical protein
MPLRAALDGRLQVAVAVDVGDAVLGDARDRGGVHLIAQGAGAAEGDVGGRLGEEVAGAELGALGRDGAHLSSSAASRTKEKAWPAFTPTTRTPLGSSA